MRWDLVIRGGSVVDGTGAPARTADVAIERAEEQFGEKPSNIWPDGPTEEIDEYEIELQNAD